MNVVNKTGFEIIDNVNTLKCGLYYSYSFMNVVLFLLRFDSSCHFGTYIDGKSEIEARVRINLCYLICIRHLIRSRVVTNRVSL